MEKPLVYFILGASDSGRRELVVDIVENGLEKTDCAAVFLSENEPEKAADETLAKSAKLVRWSWSVNEKNSRARQAAAGTLHAEIPAGATHLFFLADGRANPVDQVEALRPWLAANGAELARILCVVNCQLASRHPALPAWYDACVHFSDMVFLNRREDVPNKWISDFQARYKTQHNPAIFEFVKNNRVKNPALVLHPQARRLSHYFDEDEWANIAFDDDTVFGTEDENGDELPSEKNSKHTGDDEWMPEVDPYLERLTETRRVKEIPDITKFLPPETV